MARFKISEVLPGCNISNYISYGAGHLYILKGYINSEPDEIKDNTILYLMPVKCRRRI